jgi:Domain of unknown function (DU1801)
MLRDIDHFYLQKKEPVKSCLIALREIILKQDPVITVAWKYGMPFFCYKGKMFCYLWVHKTIKQPYIGFVEGKNLNHPKLLIEKRARMKIFLCNPEKDLPIKTIETILKQSLDLYRKGTIQIKN